MFNHRLVMPLVPETFVFQEKVQVHKFPAIGPQSLTTTNSSISLPIGGWVHTTVHTAQLGRRFVLTNIPFCKSKRAKSGQH